jgi:predicted cupin superfamily sugar epimerase
MKESAYWIRELGLVPHPEGGWFRETYRSSETIPVAGLPQRFGGERSFCTAIYFLLESGRFSALHRLKTDELWFFHAGGPMSIHCITDDGQHHVAPLGNSPDRGENLQVVVPAGSWFGAQPLGPGSFSLVSCTVAPGFDFSDFEMADRDALLNQFPRLREIIEQLTVRDPPPAIP